VAQRLPAGVIDDIVLGIRRVSLLSTEHLAPGFDLVLESAGGDSLRS
jgi:hypothetical protein